MHRFCLKITGESGAGLLSTGEIVMRALHDMGYFIVADREYPSLIKGGHACFAINVSDRPIRALSREVDAMLAIDKSSLVAYFKDLKKGGLLIHGYERPLGVKAQVEEAAKRDVKVVHQMAREIAEKNGGNVLMVNVVLAGMLWKALGLPYGEIRKSVEKQFENKPKLLPIDLRCLEAGYKSVEKEMSLFRPVKRTRHILLDGNKALALGAIHAGVRAYYAYPMSPSSSILTHFAAWAEKTGVLVKQVEDEISVAQMALGSMFMGTRALCATSGGGYDLMTETVSLAGMIETPLVVIMGQRPGPATGLPTWTAQGDLNLAIYSSHGEFPRVVLACSDPSDCFELIQYAFNLAEKYQTAVIVLTEKVIAESDVSVPMFEQKKIPIERGLVTGAALKNLKNEDRFWITPSGISKRWIPGSSPAYYFANSDEHLEDGSLTEEGEKCAAIHAKRMRKMQTIEKALPEPEIYGVSSGADISFVGWGSCKNVMLDIIEIYKKNGVRVNYLHFAYLWPVRKDAARLFFTKNKNVNLIEGNYQGQLGNLLEGQLGVRFKNRLLKYDGRPFFLEDVTKFINKWTKKH